MKQLFFLAAGMFAMGCEDYLFAGLLPAIGNSLGTEVVTVAQGCVTYGLAYMLSVPLCVFMLSKKPVRFVLISAMWIFIFGNALTLLSQDLETYFISRFVAGLGGGVFLPVAVAAGVQMVEPGFRGRAMSMMWASNSAGAVIGVPVGLWLAGKMGWRATIALVLLFAVFALFGLLISKQSFQVESLPPSLREQFHFLVDRRVLAVISVTFLTATGCLGLYSYITQILFSSGQSAEMAFSLWSLGGLIGSIGVGYVVDRIGKPPIVMLMILVILLITISLIPNLRGVPMVGLMPFLIWGAMGWASVTPQQCSLINIKADREAILVALNSSTVSFGSVVGTAVGGVALASGLSAENLPYLTSVFVFCALTCQILLIRRSTKASRTLHKNMSATQVHSMNSISR